MKITVEKKEPKVKQMFIKDVPIGYVFEILDSEYGNGGVTGLKLHKNRFILLQHGYGTDWFEIGESCWDDYSVRIIGKLTEIIVQQS